MPQIRSQIVTLNTGGGIRAAGLPRGPVREACGAEVTAYPLGYANRKRGPSDSGQLRVKSLRKGCSDGRFVAMSRQRCAAGMPRMTWSTWRPQPAHVVFRQIVQVTARHMLGVSLCGVAGTGEERLTNTGGGIIDGNHIPCPEIPPRSANPYVIGTAARLARWLSAWMVLWRCRIGCS